MANEINSLMTVGVVGTAKVFTQGWTQQGPTVSLTEVIAGHYTGDFDLTTLADGRYTVVFYENDIIAVSGYLFVRGGVEIYRAMQPDVTDSTTTIQADIAALNNLSVAEVTAIVPTTADIEGALLNEGDSQQFVAALVSAIGNTNVDEAVLVALIRADIERGGGMLDSLNDITAADVVTALQAVANDFKADVTALTAIEDAIALLNARTVAINSRVGT